MTVTRHARSRLSHLPLIVSLIFAAAVSAAAQQPSPMPTPIDVTIKRVTAIKKTDAGNPQGVWKISVRFSKPFDLNNPVDTAAARDTTNYRIVNINTGALVPVDEMSFISVQGAASTYQVELVIRNPNALNTSDLFHLYTLKLRFSGAAAKNALQLPISVGSQKPPDETELPEPGWGFSSSKSRDDSDVYGSYDLTGARGSATTGTGDVKIAVPFFGNFWNRTSKFSPFADIKASSNEKADADSLKFGLEWILPVTGGEDPNATFPFTIVHWVNTGKIEAPKNFNNINAVWENRWLFPSAQIPGNTKRFRMFIDPFVGSELGKNLKSPLAEAEHKGIFRLYAGANLTINIPIKSLSLLKGFDFTSSYIRRWPLMRELSVDEPDGGNATLLTFGKGPKDYSDSKFTVKINDYFGPFVGYTWGRLPPNYKLVDSKWTVGFLFKSKIRAK